MVMKMIDDGDYDEDDWWWWLWWRWL